MNIKINLKDPFLAVVYLFTIHKYFMVILGNKSKTKKHSSHVNSCNPHAGICVSRVFNIDLLYYSISAVGQRCLCPCPLPSGLFVLHVESLLSCCCWHDNISSWIKVRCSERTGEVVIGLLFSPLSGTFRRQTARLHFPKVQ